MEDAVNSSYLVDKNGDFYLDDVFSESKKVEDSIFVVEKDLLLKATEFKEKIWTVVLLLESPHMHEYSALFEPIEPAQGITGYNISTFIKEVINNAVADNNLNQLQKKFRLVISNPIQYQTSLYHVHKQPLRKGQDGSGARLRDKIWKAIFNISEYKEDFFNRLISYNPSLIINACSSKLKSEITRFLDENGFLNITRTVNSHPCCWHYDKERREVK